VLVEVVIQQGGILDRTVPGDNFEIQAQGGLYLFLNVDAVQYIPYSKQI
jgi:hypothetical protein